MICKVCSSAERLRIEIYLANPDFSDYQVSNIVRISRQALGRHRRNCMKKPMNDDTWAEKFLILKKTILDSRDWGDIEILKNLLNRQ